MALKQLALSGRGFTVDNLLELVGAPTDPHYLGALFAAAQRLKIVEPVGGSTRRPRWATRARLVGTADMTEPDRVRAASSTASTAYAVSGEQGDRPVPSARRRAGPRRRSPRSRAASWCIAMRGAPQRRCWTPWALPSVIYSMSLRGASYRYDDGRIGVTGRPAKQFRPVRRHRRAASTRYRASRACVEAVRNGRRRSRPSRGASKTCTRLESLGVVATTAADGRRQLVHKVDPSPLYGGKIAVIPDGDQARPGVGASRCALRSTARSDSLRLRWRPTLGKDAADHVAAGYGLRDFVPIEWESDQRLETLAGLLTQLRTWQHLPDPAHVIATLAAAATRKADGEPCWLLMVAPPSSGKTEASRLLDDIADARLNEVTCAGLLGWSKGKTVRPPPASSPESASRPS